MLASDRRRLQQICQHVGHHTAPTMVPTAAPRLRMEGKAAIVTGGANGIGRATALVLAEEGAMVTVADRDVDAGERLAAYLISTGSKALFVEVRAHERRPTPTVSLLTVCTASGNVATSMATSMATRRPCPHFVPVSDMPGVHDLL